MDNKNIISLIFLDIDGVINTRKNELDHIKRKQSICSYKIKLPERNIQNLKRIIDSDPNCKIILSSNWRLGGKEGDDMKNLCRQLSKYDISIYDTTVLNNFNGRGLQIYSYLAKFYACNGYIPPYIILDDNISDIVKYHKGHIIYCDPYHGLDEKGVNISISLLNKFRSEFNTDLI